MTTSPPAGTRLPVVRATRAGRSYALASGLQIAMIGAEDSDGAFELIEIDAVPGASPPLHVHRDFDEAFFALDGELTLRIGGETRALGPRGVAVVPAGTVHTWKNATAGDIRFLQLTVPGGMEPFTAALAAAKGPLAPEEIARIADRHGTTVVGPPI